MCVEGKLQAKDVMQTGEGGGGVGTIRVKKTDCFEKIPNICTYRALVWEL